MAEHASIVRLTRFQPASGKRDELIRRLADGAEGIRELEGCFGAQICTVRENPDVIVAISRWASQAAVAGRGRETDGYPAVCGAPDLRDLTASGF